ncbi:hypothetical protein [Micromonospora eburnea]|uniref:EspG family protein n=1 Tax=Micromonospora eburnea TaxID=227316 RepID=A0A1C6VA04_9ACTN|nr:hypothetical protein [Micromonospora eburnea]SCL63105.1 hypothetical protein GA0070604_4897 [Micromonospora eburnea]
MSEPVLSGPRDEQSLALSHADFVQVAGLLGEPVPRHLRAPVAVYPRRRREEALAASRRSLVERAVVLPGDPPRVPLSVVRLTQVVCRPALTVELHRAVAGRWAPPIRYAAAGDAAVEVLPEPGGVRLTPFHSDDLLPRLGWRAGVEKLPRTAAASVSVPLSVLRSAETVRAALAAAGVPEDAVAALAGGDLTAVSVLSRTGGGRTGAELAWATGSGYWLVPALLTPLADDRGAEPDDDATVRLTPLAGAELIDALYRSFTFDS